MKLYLHHEITEPHYTLAVEWPATSAATIYDLVWFQVFMCTLPCSNRPILPPRQPTAK